MALVALVIGTSVAAAATERLTLGLVLISTLAWAFVPVIQLGTGLWLVRAAPVGHRRPVLERYFDTHSFWSLWILAVHAIFLMWPAARGQALLFLPLALVPAALTARALVRLCGEALDLPASTARRRVAVHQALTYLVVAAYASWASAYLPRVVGLFT